MTWTGTRGRRLLGAVALLASTAALATQPSVQAPRPPAATAPGSLRLTGPAPAQARAPSPRECAQLPETVNRNLGLSTCTVRACQDGCLTMSSRRNCASHPDGQAPCPSDTWSPLKECVERVEPLSAQDCQVLPATAKTSWRVMCDPRWDCMERCQQRHDTKCQAVCEDYFSSVDGVPACPMSREFSPRQICMGRLPRAASPPAQPLALPPR